MERASGQLCTGNGEEQKFVIRFSVATTKNCYVYFKCLISLMFSERSVHNKITVSYLLLIEKELCEKHLEENDDNMRPPSSTETR